MAAASGDEVIRVDTQLGSSTVLPCIAFSHPADDRAIAVFWYKDDHIIPFYSVDARATATLADGKHHQLSELGQRSRFNVSSVPPVLQVNVQTKKDEGLYVCRVDFYRSLTQSSTVVLHVPVPTPKLIILEGRRVLSGTIGPFKENSDLELICDLTGGDPSTMQLMWWVDGVLVDVTYKVLASRKLRNIFRLKNLQRYHFMSTLTCVASEIGNVTEYLLAKNVKLDVLLRPLDVRIMPRHVTVREGELVELRCTTHGSRPPAHITWWLATFWLQNASLEQSENLNLTRSTIALVPSVADNGKSLLCKAENPDIQDSSLTDEVTLNVTFSPRISLSLKTYSNNSIAEGDTVALICQVKANPPVHQLEWVFAKQVIRDGGHHGALISGMSLVLEKLEPRHKGSYRCSAINSEGHRESNGLWLAVRHRPVCRQGRKVSYGAKKGETLSIRCEVDAEPSTVSFHWSFTNTIWRHHNVSFSSRGLKSIATYTPIDDTDFGSLFCWANNSAGEQHVPCTFTVYLPARPNPPKDCVIGNTTQTSVTLFCQPGYDGGATQQFYLFRIKPESSGIWFNLSSSIPAFTLTGLSPATTLRVNVVSANKMGYSDPVDIYVSTDSSTEKGGKQWTIGAYRIILMLSLPVLAATVIAVVVVIISRRGQSVIFY